jgi:CheY-like chemotaxis protein
MARILIAEDEAHIVRVMSLWLQRHGHQITETPNGVAALEHLASNEVDMLITDANMPGMDGVSLIRAVREERQLTFPVVMLSARCDQSELGTEVAPFA